MWRLLSSVTLAALLSFSAVADIALGDVNVQEATLAGEWDLVDIYDAIFGTSYATTLSSNDLYLLVGVDPDDYNGPTVSHFFGDQGVALEARYALYTHTLNFYDPVLPDAIANEHLLFTVWGPYVDPGSAAGPSALLDAEVEPYGFSLDVATTRAELYSEYERNADGLVHMLMLAAPDTFEPGTYLLAWEDRLDGDPQADWDYQDLVILVRPVVPEPTSVVLMGLGIAALALRRLHKLV